MPGSDEDRKVKGWKTSSRLYRRPPGLAWLLALVTVPPLLGLIGWSGLDRSNGEVELTPPTVNPSATLVAPSVNAPNVNLTGLSFAPLSIVRSGNDISLSGDLPDAAARASLLDALRRAFGPDINLTDNRNIKVGVRAPDLRGLGSLFNAAVDVPDFNFDLNGDTLTLAGTASSGNVKAGIEAAARLAWPKLKITNNIQVQAAPASTVPAAPAPAPGAGPGGPCATLQANITGLLATPINFDTDGFSLTPGSEQQLTQVADMLKACPSATVSVVGHTDNNGDDAINLALSDKRAKSVADYLISQGVAGDHVTSRGVGSVEPIASNDTEDGRAQNRRVNITVS
jgi:peptidoglycan-binding protein ArfA